MLGGDLGGLGRPGGNPAVRIKQRGVGELRWPPEPHSALAGGIEPLPGAARQHAPLELGNPAHHRVDEVSLRRRRIDGEAGNDEGDAAPVQQVDLVESVLCRPERPVEIPDHQLVARLQPGDHRLVDRTFAADGGEGLDKVFVAEAL